MTSPPPQSLGRYQIQEEIGRGMMGVVYRAFDPTLGRTVALKAVSLDFALSGEDRESFERRFVTEAQIASALSHPGLVAVHDVGRDPGTGTLFIALEYLEGHTLAAATSGGARLGWREALRITAAVADALAVAHAVGVVHRDIKPGNIMLLPSGEPKLMDFGLAKVPAVQLTSANEFFGTPAFMSPEQAAGKPVDARSDLFSLGSVLYQLLTGQRAFPAETVPAILSRLREEDPVPPSQRVPELPPAVDAVVMRALAKDPNRRYPNALAFAADLRAVLAGQAPESATN